MTLDLRYITRAASARRMLRGMLPELDAVVVGAGVIGLSIARALAHAGRDVVVVERERAIAQHASSRNSEVLHAGIYYPPGSLKARLCVQGRLALVDYCRERDVDFRLLGKLIVAARPEQRATLQQLQQRAARNGVGDLRLLDGPEVVAMEPKLRVDAGLWSPSTGIIDSHGLMRALWADAQDRGASLALETELTQVRPRDGHLEIRAGGLDTTCALLINAAGLGAPPLARQIQGLAAHHVPPLHLLKGSYFALARPAPFSHLVYPVPDAATLGIHVTLDLGGGVRFGPDKEWIDSIGYEVDPARAEGFASAIADYYPEIRVEDLVPAYAGIRAKVQGPGEPPVDFVIQGPEVHGIDGVCNLFGIESPGLTASLAIADEVLRRLGISAATR